MSPRLRFSADGIALNSKPSAETAFIGFQQDSKRAMRAPWFRTAFLGLSMAQGFIDVRT